jgi:hypothetical protein
VTAESVAPATPDAAAGFADSLVLKSVETLRVTGSRQRVGTVGRTTAVIGASVAVDEDQQAIFYRYDLRATLMDDGGESMGEVEADVVLVYATAMTDAGAEVVERFGGTTGLATARPFLGECLTSLAARIGFPGVMLPTTTTD